MVAGVQADGVAVIEGGSASVGVFVGVVNGSPAVGATATKTTACIVAGANVGRAGYVGFVGDVQGASGVGYTVGADLPAVGTDSSTLSDGHTYNGTTWSLGPSLGADAHVCKTQTVVGVVPLFDPLGSYVLH